MKEQKKGNSLRGYSSYGSEQGRNRRIRGRLLFGIGLIACLLVLIWTAVSFFFQPPELPGQTTQLPDGNGTDSSVAADWEVEGPSIAGSGRKEGKYTFLVAGLDVSSGATDTMLLLTYDINEKTLLGLNLPRDTMMNVSYNSKRLNTIYTINKGKDKETQVEKGMTALKQHVSKLTGIMPDYYVLLEWEAIGELVDALGGVEFEVPFDMDYDDPYQDLHIHQKAGRRLLDGDDAMQVIRHRKNNDGSHSEGDVGRLSIQQDFLKAVVKKCLQPAIFLKIPALAEIFAENVKTDLTVGNILAFAKSAYGMDPASGVSFQTAPLAGDAWYDRALMVTLDGEGILEIVNGGMNPYLREITLSDLELIYKKADGSYGVTNGVLADPSMGVVNVPKEDIPEEPGTEAPEEPSVPVRPQTPVQPTVPDTPQIPAEPTVPDVPQAPVDPTVPDAPPIPADPTVPDGPPTPAEPTVPDVPQAPAESTVPDTPQTPVEPTVPDTPPTPAEPTAPDVQIPVESSVPAVSQEAVENPVSDVLQGSVEQEVAPA